MSTGASEPLLYGSTADAAGGSYQTLSTEPLATPSAPLASPTYPAFPPSQQQQQQAQDHKMAVGSSSSSSSANVNSGAAAPPPGGLNAGFDSSVVVPSDAQLFQCSVLNGQGGAHAKSWLWMSRDQVCIGLTQYPVLSIWARIRHFFWLLFCCGCFQVPSNPGWRDGKPWVEDNEEDEEQEGEKVDTYGSANAGAEGLPPRLRREASLLVFSSRVDYISVSAVKAVKERLRYSLPTIWTSCFNVWELGGWIWQLVKSLFNFIFGMEFGWVVISTIMCIGCICHGANAAGLYGNPDSFKKGVHWMLALWVFTIVALAYHFEWRIVWTNEAPPSRAGRKQLGRWTIVTLLWVLAFLFFSMACIAGLVFLRKQYDFYPDQGPVNDWSKHQNLMCTSWDDRLGVIKPFEPVPQPPPPPPTFGPVPQPLQIIGIELGASFQNNYANVMFVTPISYDPIHFAITSYNGTAYGSDGNQIYTTNTLPLLPPAGTNVVVGLQFDNLRLDVNYSFSVGCSNSQGSSIPAFVNSGLPIYPTPQCSGYTSCIAPPIPNILSIRAGNPGDGLAYVSMGPAFVSPGTIPPPMFYTLYQLGVGAVGITAEIGQEIAIPQQPFHSWLGFQASATNVVGESQHTSMSYVWLEPAPTGVENMCSHIQRGALITFLFSAACALLLLAILLYLTYVRRARKRWAIVTIHGKRQWGLPASVLLELADARAVESFFNRTIGKGQYDLASAGYPSQHRLQNKRD